MNFREALIATYLQNPCQVLPNPLWKTLTQLSRFETAYGSSDGSISWLALYGEGVPFIGWGRNRESFGPEFTRFVHTDFALIHHDYAASFPTTRFRIRKAYFRLLHTHQTIPSVLLPAGFRFASVDVTSQAEAVANLIARCYDDMRPSPETVFSWAQHSVFDPDLWLWVMDTATGTPVGLGIAEADISVSEGALEWIQVLPQYRGCGIGKAIVCELLPRLQSRVDFTTVSGEVDNPMHPEILYRRCGFEGDDIWWLLRVSGFSRKIA